MNFSSSVDAFPRSEFAKKQLAEALNKQKTPVPEKTQMMEEIKKVEQTKEEDSPIRQKNLNLDKSNRLSDEKIYQEQLKKNIILYSVASSVLTTSLLFVIQSQSFRNFCKKIMLGTAQSLSNNLNTFIESYKEVQRFDWYEPYYVFFDCNAF